MARVKTTARRPAGKKPAGNKPAGKKPAGNKPAGNKPAGNKPAGNKPAGNKPAGNKPAGKKPAGKKPPSVPSRLDAAFDFGALRDRIVAASIQAVAEVRRDHPDDPICAFALYSDEGAMTVCPAMDLTSARAARLADDPDDAADAAFSPAEWALESVGAERAFDAICDEVRDHVSTYPTQFKVFRDQLFETCLEALEALRDRAAFGPGGDVLLLFAVSDSALRPAVELARLTRLMGAGSPHVAAFRRWTQSWSTN